jgi:hypothetical protein
MVELNAPGVDIEQLAVTRIFAGPGQPLLVGQLWQKQTAILVFLRHFACIGCRAHAAQVWADRARYQSSGARIIFIGNGQPNWIESFRQDLGIDQGVVLTDPSLRSFAAAGLRTGFFNLVSPQSAINMIKLVKEGYRQTPYSNDAGSHWQMGGILAVNKHGKGLFHYASKSVGDFPDEPYLRVIFQDEKSNL